MRCRAPAPSPQGPVEEAPRRDGRIVVTGELRQRMEGWGASVVTDTPVDPLVNPKGLSLRQLYDLDRRVFREARVNLIRVFGPGYGFAAGVARSVWRFHPRGVTTYVLTQRR